MHNIVLGKIEKLIIHFISNKNSGDGVRLAEELTDFSKVEDRLNHLLSSNFKAEDLYYFYLDSDLELNQVYKFVSSLLSDKPSFIEESKNIGSYLYDKSTHPNIKGGELCVVHIKDCQLNDEVVDCIALFKSENKDTILKVDTTSKGFDLTDISGLNINRLDKGCLIFNTEKEDGFVVSIIDNTNKGSEAQYWKDDFLSVRPKKDDFHQTNQFLGIAKQFVTNELSNDFDISKTDKIDFLNRSVDYFKKHENFNKAEFEDEVFGDSSVIESFRKFDNSFREENELDLKDNFQISAQAVKKQARVFKSVLKLDKNFHVYIHGNKNLIKKGVENDGRKYYKIYFEEET